MVVESLKRPKHQKNKCSILITALVSDLEKNYHEEMFWVEDADSDEGIVLRQQIAIYLLSSKAIPKSLTSWNWN